MFDIESRVPLTKCVVYLVGRRGWSKVEEVIVVVGVVLVMRAVKWELLCVLKIVMGLCREWGKILSCQALRTV